MEIIAIVVALTVFAVLVGFLVKKLLAADQARLEREQSDDVLARVSGAAGAGSLFGFSSATRRRALKVREQLPDALDMIANSLTAGLTLPQAILRNLDHFSPEVQTEFARIIYDTRLGYSIGDAFGNFAERVGLRDAKLIAIASRIGVEHGGNIGESYRMLSSLLRDNLAFEMELRAMTTEGRMQALVMSSLPFALIAILAVINPDLMLPLITTAAGWGVIGVLCGMIAVAYVWIRKIVDIEV